MTKPNIVLLIGSAPDAVDCKDWDRSHFDAIVAVNNAWRIRDDWDYLVCPDDFPDNRRPSHVEKNQTLIGPSSYVPANNAFGGIVYNGGTMAFTAGYWALHALQPTVLAFLGCDMVYDSQGPSHFYGQGAPDPLRDDITLRNLEAKSARLMLQAAHHGCACVRLSDGPSRLVFPSADKERLDGIESLGVQAGGELFDQAQAMEKRLGYVVPSGRYWQNTDEFSTQEIDAIDTAWLKAAAPRTEFEQAHMRAVG